MIKKNNAPISKDMIYLIKEEKEEKSIFNNHAETRQKYNKLKQKVKKE